jgi:hypothetical protein
MAVKGENGPSLPRYSAKKANRTPRYRHNLLDYFWRWNIALAGVSSAEGKSTPA